MFSLKIIAFLTLGRGCLCSILRDNKLYRDITRKVLKLFLWIILQFRTAHFRVDLRY